MFYNNREKVVKDIILLTITPSDREAAALLALKNPLEMLYNECLKMEDKFIQIIHEGIDNGIKYAVEQFDKNKSLQKFPKKESSDINRGDLKPKKPRKSSILENLKKRCENIKAADKQTGKSKKKDAEID